MGQYQEWLLAQEVDKRLQVELEALEAQILYLKERIVTLEQTMPETENIILLALQAYLRAQEEQLKVASASVVSSRVGQQEAPVVEAPQTVAGSSASSLASVPADMLAFFEEQRRTDLNFSLWRQSELGTENAEHPWDPETRRLNENIQRWFERWHREITSRAQTEVRDGQ